MTKLTGFICVAALAACGGGGGGNGPKEACKDFSTAYCGQLYACLTEAERAAAGLPATEAACVTEFNDQAGCDAQTEENACENNETYHGDKASDCVDQVAGLDCATVRAGVDPETDTPACNEVCTVD